MNVMSTQLLRSRKAERPTVGSQLKVPKNVITICLRQIIAVEIQRRKGNGGPEHDPPVNLPDQCLQENVSNSERNYASESLRRRCLPFLP